jgi:hypothetical protein
MPDRNLRLVNRKTAAWAKGKRVHEHLRMNAGTTVHDLAGAIFTPWADLATYAKRDRYYLNLAFSKPLERRPSLFITVKSVMKNIGFAFGIVCSAVYLSLRYGFTGAVLPWRYHLRFARYHLFVARERLRQFFLAKNYAPPAA